MRELETQRPQGPEVQYITREERGDVAMPPKN